MQSTNYVHHIKISIKSLWLTANMSKWEDWNVEVLLTVSTYICLAEFVYLYLFFLLGLRFMSFPLWLSDKSQGQETHPSSQLCLKTLGW